jgi:MFS family permease
MFPKAKTMNRFLVAAYSYRALGEFILIVPVFAVMFADRGLTALQISVLFVVWSGTSFILQVPTGILADVYSRKHLLVIAQLSKALCYISWLLWPTFAGFLAGFILWGIADALVSGTLEALIYDELKASKRSSDYAKVSGRAGAAYFISTMLAALSASVFIVFGYSVMLGMSSAASLLAGITALLFPTVSRAAKVEKANYLAIAWQGIVILKNDLIVRRIVITAAVLTMVSKGLMEFWTLIATQVGLPHQGLGIFLAVVAGSQAVAANLAHRYEKLSIKSLYALFVLGGMLLIGLAMHLSFGTLVLVVLFTALATFLGVLFSTQLQHAIASNTRATVLSVKSLIDDLGVLAVFLSFGFIATEISYALALGVFGALVVGVGAIYLWK